MIIAISIRMYNVFLLNVISSFISSLFKLIVLEIVLEKGLGLDSFVETSGLLISPSS